MTSTRNLVGETQSELWGDAVDLVSSSNEKLFIAVSGNPTVWGIDASNGYVSELSYTLPSLESSGVSAIYFAQPWQRLYVGTEIALFTADQDGNYVYHEWVEGSLDAPALDFSFDPSFSGISFAILVISSMGQKFD